MRSGSPGEAARRGRGFLQLPWIIKGLALLTVIGVLFGVGACLIGAKNFSDYYRENFGVPEGVPAAGADTLAEADVRNEEILASLAAYPGSVLIETDIWDELCCRPTQLYRHLTHVYATDATMDDVLAYYRERLTEKGWDYVGEGSLGTGHWFRKGNIDLIVTLLGSTPSPDLPYQLRKKVPAATPPPEDSAFFAITAGRRIDCFREECFAVED